MAEKQVRSTEGRASRCRRFRFAAMYAAVTTPADRVATHAYAVPVVRPVPPQVRDVPDTTW